MAFASESSSIRPASSEVPKVSPEGGSAFSFLALNPDRVSIGLPGLLLMERRGLLGHLVCGETDGPPAAARDDPAAAGLGRHQT